MADAVSQVGDRIEHLLAEIRAMVAPAAMERIDELVRCILSLYGSGLERMMAILDENKAGTLIDRLVSDRLLASLLVLHGLHSEEAEPGLVQIRNRPETRA
jgi:hypothetical protein